MKRRGWFLMVLGIGATEPLWAASEIASTAVHPLWMTPFWLLLTMIAVAPFVHREWWEHNYPPVAVGLGLLVAAYYAVGLRETGRLWHTLEDISASSPWSDRSTL